MTAFSLNRVFSYSLKQLRRIDIYFNSSVCNAILPDFRVLSPNVCWAGVPSIEEFRLSIGQCSRKEVNMKKMHKRWRSYSKQKLAFKQTTGGTCRRSRALFQSFFSFFFFFFNVSFFCRSYSRQFIALNSTFQKLKINWRNWRLNVAYGTCHPLLVKLRKVGVTAGNTLVPRIINYLLYYSTWVVLKDILMTFVSFHYCNYLKLWDVLKHVFNVNFSNCVACVFQTYRRQMAKLLKRFPYIRALQI